MGMVGWWRLEDGQQVQKTENLEDENSDDYSDCQYSDEDWFLSKFGMTMEAACYAAARVQLPARRASVVRQSASPLVAVVKSARRMQKIRKSALKSQDIRRRRQRHLKECICGTFSD